MKILGLKGFGPIESRIDPFFKSDSGYFPNTLNWNRRKIVKAMEVYHEFFPSEDYIAIGFSDGATWASLLPQLDPHCVGVIAHSGVRWTEPVKGCVPTLLLFTNGDKASVTQGTVDNFCELSEGCRLKSSTHIAELEPDERFRPKGINAWLFKRLGLWNHQFGNGIKLMQDWCKNVFDFDLPIERDYCDGNRTKRRWTFEAC